MEEGQSETAAPASVDERLIEELSRLAAIVEPLPEHVDVVVRAIFSRDNPHSWADDLGLN